MPSQTLLSSGDTPAGEALGPPPASSRFYREAPARVALRMLGVAGLFHAVYATYLSTRWGYMGFEMVRAPFWMIAATYGLAAAPALLLPRSTNRRTIVVFYLLYLLLYVPSQFCLLFTTGGSAEASQIALVLAAGFGILAWSLRLAVWPIRVRPLGERWFLGLLIAATILCFFVVLRVGWSNLRFVSFFDASAVRRAREASSGLFDPLGAGYLIAWVQYVVAPMLLLYGLRRGRLYLVALGCAAEVLFYAATTAKFALLVPLLVVASWRLARPRQERRFVRRLAWGTMGLFSTVIVANIVLGIPNRLEAVLTYFVQRYFGYQGFSTVLYANFAASHAHTFWSHVRGVASIVTYPFDQTVPFMVGMYWRGTPGLSAPGHPWASDGLLAAGLGGVIVISVVIAVVFWATDAAISRLRTDVLAPLLLVQAIMLSESSIFTQLLTNGWLLLCALALVAPFSMRTTNDRVRGEGHGQPRGGAPAAGIAGDVHP